MEVVNINLSNIKPYQRNPRNNAKAVEKVAESIRQFGFQQPLVLDKDNVIVCGHTRYAAAKKLKLKSVPCVLATSLTEEQIRAYRLADNKVAEASEWDVSLLAEELDDILDIDMSDFGFEVPDFLDDVDDTDKDDTSYYGDERERTFEAYNLYDVDNRRLTDKWQMPIIKKCDHIPKDLLGFNYAKTSKDFQKGIHFYIDDYQFERIWSAPHDYMDILKQFDCVLTPDFSLYTEMPLPMQMWNVYRSKMVGQIMQDYGITVIPTLQWCKENTYPFAFDGIERGGTVSVSTIGVKQDDNARDIWVAGMDEAIRQLEPKNIIVYGGDIGYDFGNINVVYIKNHNTERLSEA